jgi:hypothetical protein
MEFETYYEQSGLALNDFGFAEKKRKYGKDDGPHYTGKSAAQLHQTRMTKPGARAHVG